jgi:TonB family protein
MNSAIEASIVSASSSLPLSIVAKATLVTALGLGVALLANRKRAAFRHSFLAATFGVLLALPVVSAIARPVGISLPDALARKLAKAPGAQFGATASFAPKTPSGVSSERKASRWSIASLLTAGWIAGIVVFLLPVAAGLRQVSRLRRSGLRWQHGQSIADGLARATGMRRSVDVLLCEGLAGPMTCGIARPAIVLPGDAPGWDREDLCRAMVHEMEHVRRGDWAIQCVARAVCSLYWFHPLVWMARRRLEVAAEGACDDAVLERSEPTAYADQLVAVAQRFSATAKSPFPEMASRADLASRVTAVLDRSQRRGPAGAFCVTAATVAAAAVVVTLSPLRLVAAPQQAGGTPRLRTDTKLVVTQVKVWYPNGNPVEGLTANDFEVTEDDVPQPIRFCEFQKASEIDPDAGHYILGYYPRNSNPDGQFRKINITVKTATVAKVEHRRGYFMNHNSGLAQSSVAPGPELRDTTPAYDKPPVLFFKRDADYSETARQAKYQGTVLLYVEIDEAGGVRNILVARSLGLGLDEKAIEAVKEWRFRPATKDGNPVAVHTQVEVNFRLP